MYIQVIMQHTTPGCFENKRNFTCIAFTSSVCPMLITVSTQYWTHELSKAKSKLVFLCSYPPCTLTYLDHSNSKLSPRLLRDQHGSGTGLRPRNLYQCSQDHQINTMISNWPMTRVRASDFPTSHKADKVEHLGHKSRQFRFRRILWSTSPDSVHHSSF